MRFLAIVLAALIYYGLGDRVPPLGIGWAGMGTAAVFMLALDMHEADKKNG